MSDDAEASNDLSTATRQDAILPAAVLADPLGVARTKAGSLHDNRV